MLLYRVLRYFGLVGQEPGKLSHFKAMRADYYPIVEKRLDEAYRLQGMTGLALTVRTQQIATEVCRLGREPALAESQEFLDYVKTFEPTIEAVIRASGARSKYKAESSASPAEIEKLTRTFIWDPRHDAETARDTLQRAVQMTEQVMFAIRTLDCRKQALRSDKRHIKKYGIEEGQESYRELLDRTLAIYRQLAWSLGPLNVREELKYTLELYADQPKWQDQSKIRRMMKVIDEDGYRSTTKTKRAKAAPLRPALSSEATAQRSIDQIVSDLEKLKEWEISRGSEVSDEIEALTADLPELRVRYAQQSEGLRMATALYDETLKSARAVLQEKQALVRDMEARNGFSEEYETPQSVTSLIEATVEDAKASLLPTDLFTGENTSNQNIEITPFMTDIDLITHEAKDDNTVIRLKDEIRQLRKQNTLSNIQKSELQLQCEQTKRLAAANEQKADKITRRVIALEAAIPQLQKEIEEIKFDLVGMQNGTPASNEYPPLNQLENWVNTKLKGRVRIHRDAFNEVASPGFTHIHPEWIYQGLELLGTHFWNQKMSGSLGNGAAQELRQTFQKNMQALSMRIGGSITDLGSQKIRNQYYASFDGQRVFLDQHLRRGNSRDPARQLCIYFAWHDKTNTVVVGHLPTHLDTR